MKKNGLLLLLMFVLWGTSYAQTQTITGKVTSSDDGSPLPGVSIVVKGTTTGTVTNIDGIYSLSISNPDATLTFNFVGMEKQEIAVQGKNVIDVIMAPNVIGVDEVIVIGYGVQKKSVVTAAISRVSADDLNGQKPSRIEDVLKGKVSGVQITQSSGQPGADSKVRIRGIGTINDSDPLYIVDGMAVEGGINYLNPADIQSVEILKDAASAAVYGARAANGVVLVTTKQGKGKATISYDMSYGIQNPWKLREVLNATEYMVLMNEKKYNDGSSPVYTADQIAQAGEGTNWQKETFNFDAPVQSHQVSVNGGSDKSSYFLSFGYYNQEGLVGGNFGKSNYERYSVRSNTTMTVFEEKSRDFLNKITVGSNIGYTRTLSSGIEANSEYGSILGSALSFDPTVSVYATEAEAASILAQYPYAVTDDQGRVFSLPPAGFQEIANPVAMLNQPNSSKDNSDKIVSSFYGEIDILPGLKFKSSFGVDLSFWGNDGYTFPYYLASQGKNTETSSVSSSMNRGYRWQVENILTYNKSFGEHNINLLVGQSANKYTYRTLSGTDFNLAELDPTKAVIDYATADQSEERTSGGTGGYSAKTLASYFGRVDYNYAERYMIQATIRRDGSSNFGPNNKWAIFPSVSVGWNVMNEPFIEDIRPDWFNAFKARFSWGKNGNERIGAFNYAATISGSQNYYFGGGYSIANGSNSGTMQYGSSASKLSNPDIRWEESTQTDAGFDAQFFQGLLTFSFDYFMKKTSGMLKEVTLPVYVGKSKPIGNVGDMKNWGYEFELGFKKAFGDVNFFASANVSRLYNELVNLGNDTGFEIEQTADASGLGAFVRASNGDVFPYFYGCQTDGLFQNWAEVNAYVNSEGALIQPNAQPGDVRFVDINNNGSIDDGDRTKIGKGMPDWTYGLNLGADYKGFDVSLFFQGTQGNDVFDFAMRGDIPGTNYPAWMLDRWHGEGTSNRIPRMSDTNPNQNWRSSDLFVKDGSFIRLKNAQLGYTLPKDLTSKLSISKLRVFVSGENLLTFTKYDGFDPEMASGNYTTIGVDRGCYPQARTISFGANIAF